MRTRVPVRISSRRANSGAALVVGLILLLVMTLLAISGMNTSTTELQMAANMQYGEKAFQAAEVGIERAFRSGSYSTTGGAVPLNGTVATGQPETYAISPSGVVTGKQLSRVSVDDLEALLGSAQAG